MGLQKEQIDKPVFKNLSSVKFEFENELDQSMIYGTIDKDTEKEHSVILCPHTDLETEIDLKDPDLDQEFNGMEIHYLKMIYRMQKIYQ